MKKKRKEGFGIEMIGFGTFVEDDVGQTENERKEKKERRNFSFKTQKVVAFKVIHLLSKIVKIYFYFCLENVNYSSFFNKFRFCKKKKKVPNTACSDIFNVGMNLLA